MKFGGSSLADAERILAVSDIVRHRLHRRPVVVLSALAGVTDLLEQGIARAQVGTHEALEPILADLQRRHRWALAGSVEDPRRRHDLTLEIDRLFEDLRQRLRSMRILAEGTPRASDAVLACGESLSARIVCAAFRDRGLPATLVDARQIVVTDDRFGGARPDFARVRERCESILAPLLECDELPVLSGFVGATPSGETTTLGRGGSDTSAAVVGLMPGVEEIQIWSDVDGLMSADPRLVPAARNLARVSFAEAAELGLYGAKVLHPDAIAPAVRRGIPVRVLNSMKPEAAGTLVVEERPGEAADGPVAVACRTGVRLVRAGSRTMRVDSAFVPRILDGCRRAGIAPELLLATEVAVSLVVEGDAPLERLRQELEGEAELTALEDQAMLCVVGSGLARRRELRRRVLAELANWSPALVASGASMTSMVAVVERAVLERALGDLHRRFFERSEVG